VYLTSTLAPFIKDGKKNNTIIKTNKPSFLEKGNLVLLKRRYKSSIALNKTKGSKLKL
jgi:hypothetical protein